MSNEKPAPPSPPSQRSKGRPRAFDRDAALIRALDVFWRRGYEPASVAELCEAMGINPPSLYAAFGNKAQLFLETVNHYEKVYWDATWERMDEQPDLHRALKDFFREAAGILSTPEAPCGCLVVLSAINVSPESQGVIDALTRLRQEGRDAFLKRLKRGINEGSLPPKTDVKTLAAALNTMLEGMSLQAREGLSRAQLEGIAMSALAMVPPRPEGRGRA
ncbi:TetR/AcrR family transcriptional regulator [Myxococcaceae bacterium GXIMD 01537]